MQKQTSILLSILLLTLATACAGYVEAQADPKSPTVTPETMASSTPQKISRTPAADCPLTVPQDPPFTPPGPYDTLGFRDEFWFGSPSLWTVIWNGGIWHGLPYEADSGYTQKIFWWREGYVWNEEPEPNLTVTGERLDAESPPLRASKATNAFANDIGSAMLTGVKFPTAGCWKITGKYKDAELSFVVWVTP